MFEKAKENTRKIFRCLHISWILGFSLAVPTFAASSDTCSADAMNTFLISHGYPAAFLETLIAPQVESLYTSAADNNTYFLGFATESGAIEPDYTTYRRSLESDVELTVMVGFSPAPSDDSQKMSEVYVYVYYDWINIPLIRYCDTISVHWDSSLFAYSSMHATDYAQSGSSGQWVTNAVWNSPTKLEQDGLCYSPYIRYAEFLGTASAPAAGLKGNAEITLIPKIDMPTGTDTSAPLQINTFFNAEYVHSTLAAAPALFLLVLLLAAAFVFLRR